MLSCLFLVVTYILLLQAHIQTFRGRILETILSLRFLVFQYGIVYKLHLTGNDTSLAVAFLSFILLMFSFYRQVVITKQPPKFSHPYKLEIISCIHILLCQFSAVSANKLCVFTCKNEHVIVCTTSHIADLTLWILEKISCAKWRQWIILMPKKSLRKFS